MKIKLNKKRLIEGVDYSESIYLCSANKLNDKKIIIKPIMCGSIVLFYQVNVIDYLGVNLVLCDNYSQLRKKITELVNDF